MFWIDKHNKGKRRKGHQIVNRFLREAWNEQDGQYVNCTYASFKRNHKWRDCFTENNMDSAVIA